MATRLLTMACLLLLFFFFFFFSVFTISDMDTLFGALAGGPSSRTVKKKIRPLPLFNTSSSSSFTDLLDAYNQWDAKVGCSSMSSDGNSGASISHNPSLQSPHPVACSSLKQKHVVVYIKEWTWIPDNLQNLYSCDCGLTCMWTKSQILADDPDVLLYESATPPRQVFITMPLSNFIWPLEFRSCPYNKRTIMLIGFACRFRYVCIPISRSWMSNLSKIVKAMGGLLFMLIRGVEESR